MARHRNPSAKVIGLSVGALAVGGVAVWYFFLRKKPTLAYMPGATPTLAQQASGPANPRTTAAIQAGQGLLTSLFPGQGVPK